MGFITTIAANFPFPAWLVDAAFVICAVWLVVGFAIRIFKFVDKTTNSNCLLTSIQTEVQSINRKNSSLIEKFNTLIAALAEKNAIENPELFSMNSPVSY